jgi:hypothetical protein
MSIDAVLGAIMLVVVVGLGLLQAGWVGASINDSSPTYVYVFSSLDGEWRGCTDEDHGTSLTEIQCRVLPQDFNARKYEKDVRTRLGVANAVIVGVMFLMYILLLLLLFFSPYTHIHPLTHAVPSSTSSPPSPCAATLASTPPNVVAQPALPAAHPHSCTTSASTSPQTFLVL